MHNKQNVFDDFIACGEYLVQRGYTSPAKLVTQVRPIWVLQSADCGCFRRSPHAVEAAQQTIQWATAGDSNDSLACRVGAMEACWSLPAPTR